MAIERERVRLQRAPRVVDLGCGAGHFVSELTSAGIDTLGIDPADSAHAIFTASRRPGRLVQAAADVDALRPFGTFDVVVSMEVVEHVYEPRKYAAALRALMAPGGLAVVTTPYHGYWKNLSIAMLGKFDAHFTALWDYGHIKFWSRRTLTALLAEQGLTVERFERVGRAVPALAKSMIVHARAPL
ncbi:MAG: class I SAM-dependent methyltransferase [Planctomycetota bacterium]